MCQPHKITHFMFIAVSNVWNKDKKMNHAPAAAVWWVMNSLLVRLTDSGCASQQTGCKVTKNWLECRSAEQIFSNKSLSYAGYANKKKCHCLPMSTFGFCGLCWTGTYSCHLSPSFKQLMLHEDVQKELNCPFKSSIFLTHSHFKLLSQPIFIQP